MSDQPHGDDGHDLDTRLIGAAEYRRRSRRSILAGGLAAAAGVGGWRWVMDQPADGNIPSVVRGGLEFNEAVWTSVYDSSSRVPTFDVDEARPLRINGLQGMRTAVDLDAWELTVSSDVEGVPRRYTLDDITALGEIDLVMEHKCIEGWSNITHWTGVPFSSFAVPLLAEWGVDFPYVSLITVGGGYYVGLDTAAALHPQVLLGTGLDGEPLTQEHGAPLRLVSPIHYGTKSIKRIGRIHFTRTRPRDFWAERGYDWHSQH